MLVLVLVFVLVLLLLLLVLMVMVVMVLAVAGGQRFLSKHRERSSHHGMHTHLQRQLFPFRMKTLNEFLLMVRKDSFPQRKLMTVSWSIQQLTSLTKLPAFWPEVNYFKFIWPIKNYNVLMYKQTIL